MHKATGWLAAGLMVATAALPLSAQAEDPKAPPAKSAPAAKPAPAKPAAPPPPPAAARPAPPPPAAARPAPPPAVARPAAPPPVRQAAPPPVHRPSAPPPQVRRDTAPPPPKAPAVVQQHREQFHERGSQQTPPAAVAPSTAKTVAPSAATQAVSPSTAKTVAPSAGTQAVSPSTASPQPTPQATINPRDERLTRLREDRELRRLPPAQRAQRLEQIKQAREQRVQKTLTASPDAKTASPQAVTSKTLSPTDLRRQQRAERLLREREARELRRLPPAQRAERLQQIRQAREQRAVQRQGLTASPNAAFTANAQARRNGQARITPQAAQQGRFAARFASVQARSGTTWRTSHDPARRAWRRGYRAAFVPWFGPVFWPYAYSDVFDYTFWPAGYDDGYWSYVYDDFFDGIFWGEVGPPDGYVEGPAYGPNGSRATQQPPNYNAVQDLCKQPGSGVTAWPFGEIEQKVGLTDVQKVLLADLRGAAGDAAAGFKASCPQENAFPLTPPGRLDAMTARLTATRDAVRTVRPSLERFYDSLSDEQKERFNQIGPQKASPNAEAREAQDTKSCKDPKSGLTNLPIEKIEDTVRPTEAQLAKLDALEKATSEGVSILQSACPEDTPVTPPGRLEAMDKRLTAMVDAANAVKPALEDFYGSLTGEQKARFNRIGRELASTSGDARR